MTAEGDTATTLGRRSATAWPMPGTDSGMSLRERRAAPLFKVDALGARRGRFFLGPVTFELARGAVLGLLGPNGAGKTTLVRTMLGLLDASDGSVLIDNQRLQGRDHRFLSAVGMVPDDPNELVQELTATEYWRLLARAHFKHGKHSNMEEMLRRAEMLARWFDLRTNDRQLISTYSHGMRKKAQIVGALLHQPRLVIMDEPRNGLDPIGIRQLEELVARQRRDGIAFILSSHDLHWAERVCTDVLILNHGQVVLMERLAKGMASSLEDRFFDLIGPAPGPKPTLDTRQC